jgi:tRNA threonylcarbamoyl adenosine modification protein (Sua5/YciO/YrdC/YwlC family)
MRLRIDAERPAPRKLEPAVTALRQGKVIIYPTDTGYAYGCALSSVKGIATLRRVKGIHEKHAKPLTMLVSDLHAIGKYGVMSNTAFRTVRRILPGPYTLVLRGTSDVPRAMKNRDNEVGLRLPDHATCSMLVQMLGEPLLTGSLTPGEQPPELEDPEDFEARVRGDVDVILDAGPLWPEPSTVIRFDETDVHILREGKGPVPT